VIRRVRQSTMPFLWSEAPFDRTDDAAARVMAEATEFGLVEGFAVPIFTTHGFQAIVTFGAKQLSLSHDARAGLHLVAIYAHARARALTPGRTSGIKPGKPRLSVREIECLKWSSEGKSTWEISVILCLSEKTVEQYLGRAASKLGAANRVQSVAEALRQSLIS
jgi:LuxR family quorum sensing-dependent transcriptional regulator